jgi:hypothetical protein
MLVCQWHLDILYGKQAEAVRVIRAWGHEKFASSTCSSRWESSRMRSREWLRRNSGSIPRH